MYQDDRNIEVEGIVQYSQEESIWVAKVNWWDIVEEKSENVI